MTQADVGAGLTAIHAAQVIRLSARFARVLAETDAALTASAALPHDLHLLKGAALAADDVALAAACHVAEDAFLAGSAEALRAALTALLAHAARLPVALPPPDIISLRQRLREGFLALRRFAAVDAVLVLDIAPGWLARTDFLLDILPQLLRNALAHGAEPASARLASGRPAQMTVVVRAVCGADRWRLLVCDDGRGTARPVAPEADLLAGRGWGVAAVRAAVAQLPDGRLRYRGSAGRGSCVRITCRH